MAENNKDGITIHDEKLGDIKLSASELNALEGNKDVNVDEKDDGDVNEYAKIINPKDAFMTDQEYKAEVMRQLAKANLLEEPHLDAPDSEYEEYKRKVNAITEPLYMKRVNGCRLTRETCTPFMVL